MDERILLVDDSRLNLKILDRVLGDQGFELLHATNGREALRVARAETPDLILLDLVMPDMDGYHVCRELKSERGTADIPVIFLSATSEGASKVKALNLGASDFIPKTFSRDEVIARVRTQLRIRSLTKSLTFANEELRARQAQIDADLRAAATIQRALLPSENIELDGLELTWFFLPSEVIGGDLFNVVALDERRVALYMVDVSGHGVSSALVAVSVVHALSPLGRRGTRRELPSAVLDDLEELYPQERFDKILSVFYAVLDVESGELTYANAGHPPPLLLRADGTLETLDAGGPMIGTGLARFEDERLGLTSGDRLILYTDGITEHHGPEGELFGRERLDRLVQRLGDRPLPDLPPALMAALAEHGGAVAPRDDVSFLALDFAG